MKKKQKTKTKRRKKERKKKKKRKRERDGSVAPFSMLRHLKEGGGGSGGRKGVLIGKGYSNNPTANSRGYHQAQQTAETQRRTRRVARQKKWS
jgi:hypothetical protein